MNFSRLQSSSLEARHRSSDLRLHWTTVVASLVLCFDVVPQQILCSEQPRALVAHDEVDALDLAIDQDILLDQLALDLVGEVLGASGFHLVLIGELQGGGGGGVQQLLSLLSCQLVPLSKAFPVLLLILLTNLEDYRRMKQKLC